MKSAARQFEGIAIKSNTFCVLFDQFRTFCDFIISICSNIWEALYCSTADCALVNIPFSPILKFIATPANIKRIIIVITNDTIVIPFMPFKFFSYYPTPPSVFFCNYFWLYQYSFIISTFYLFTFSIFSLLMLFLYFKNQKTMYFRFV